MCAQTQTKTHARTVHTHTHTVCLHLSVLPSLHILLCTKLTSLYYFLYHLRCPFDKGSMTCGIAFSLGLDVTA